MGSRRIEKPPDDLAGVVDGVGRAGRAESGRPIGGAMVVSPLPESRNPLNSK